MLPSGYSWAHALLGGVLIGLASLIAVVVTGKIPGISGLFSRILVPRKGDTAWRIVFLVGLMTGAAVAFAFSDTALVYRPVQSLGIVAIAGVLVGFGTRLSGGCTSGHGVCGIGLGSKSGIVATMSFMAAAMVTVYLLQPIAFPPGR